MSCLSCKSQDKQLIYDKVDLKLIKTHYDNKVLKEQFFIKKSNQKKDSTYLKFNSKGDTLVKGFYKNGQKHGIWEEINHNFEVTGYSKLLEYHNDTLKKEIEKSWATKKRQILNSQKTSIYGDSLYVTFQNWGGDTARFPLIHNETIFFDADNPDQSNASIYVKTMYYNTNLVKSEEFRINLNDQWQKYYSPKGKLYKYLVYTKDGELKQLTIYDDNEQTAQVYHISKKETIVDQKEGTVDYKYYDQNNKRLPSELFELTYP